MNENPKRWLMGLFVSESVRNDLKSLYHGKELDAKLYEFYIQKIKYIMGVFGVGTFLFLAFLWNKSCNKAISNEAFLARNGYGEGDRILELNLYREGSERPEKVKVNVSEKKYTNEEILEFSKKIKDEIERTVKGENDSLDKVNKDLSFPNRIDGYPFDLTYKTDNPLLLDNNGQINNEKIKERDEKNNGIIICITVTLAYFDYSEDYYFFVRVYKKEENFEDAFSQAVEKALNIQDKASITEDYMELPRRVGGINIFFSEGNDSTGFMILILTLVLIGSVYFGKDREIKKQIDEKNNEMIKMYPELVNKFALFYNAGMPIKSIWKRICHDYTEEREKGCGSKAIYEEMLISDSAMKEGKSELEAYEDFAKRVNLSLYRNFIGILEQAVTKGRKDVGNILSNESLKAFNERKLNAKKLSEEAGTKLLIPMFMMLSIVIIMIIFPAFYSFKF